MRVRNNQESHRNPKTVLMDKCLLIGKNAFTGKIEAIRMV